MSVRQSLIPLVGDGYTVTEKKAVQHGEPGREVVLEDGKERHEFFFADDRKITDDHAAEIINSYLRS